MNGIRALRRVTAQARRRRRDAPSHGLAALGVVAFIMAFAAFASWWAHPFNAVGFAVLAGVSTAQWLGFVTARAARVVIWVVTAAWIGYVVFWLSGLSGA